MKVAPLQYLAFHAIVFDAFKKSFPFSLNSPFVSGVVLKNWGKNSNFSVKSKVWRKGATPMNFVCF